MEHWQNRFFNRPLTRPIFLAVRWARVTELWASYCVRQALMRLHFLRAIEVDFDRIDLEQRLRYQALMDASLPFQPPQLQRNPLRITGTEAPMLGWERGIWV